MKTKTTKTRKAKPKIQLTVKSQPYPRRPENLIAEICEIHWLLEEMKGLYGTMDELLAQAVAQGLTVTDKFVIVDNFKEKNVIFKTTAVKRYDVKMR
jgi:hypothetical protein